MNIPIIYKIIADRMHINSFQGDMSREKAQNVLRIIFRFPKQSITTIMGEMKDMGLIECVTRTHVKVIKLKEK